MTTIEVLALALVVTALTAIAITAYAATLWQEREQSRELLKARACDYARVTRELAEKHLASEARLDGFRKLAAEIEAAEPDIVTTNPAAL